MDASELIARLNPITQNAGRVGVSTVPGLGAFDAAAALAGLPRGPYLLARVMLALDESCRRELEKQLWSEMCSFAYAEKWIVPIGQELLRKMAKIAIAEVVDPALCKGCRGRGSIYPRGGLARACGACFGSGRGVLSASAKARAVGMDKSNWCRLWGARYLVFVTLARNWEQVIHAHVRDKMRSVI